MKSHPIKTFVAALRKHRGMNDLLSYLIQWDDCTILHKDGALSRHFVYIAPDLDSSSDPDVDYHAQTWQKSFDFLGNGWMVETNVVSHLLQSSTEPQEFPEVVSALIDDERRLQYQEGHYFTTTHYLSITWKPEQLMASRLRRFAMEGAAMRPDSASRLGEELRQFNKTVGEWLGYLKRSLLRIEPLSGDDLTTFLYQSITGQKQRLATPYVGAFLDCYLSGEDFVAGYQPKIGKKFIKVLSLDDLPTESYPSILDSLSYFPLEYRWSSRFIGLDRRTAKTYLKRYERSWSSKAIGVLGVIRESMGLSAKRDQDAQHTADRLKIAQIENSAGRLGYGFYNSVIVLMHDDVAFLNKAAEAIITRIQQLDFRVRDESVNATEAYLGSIPSHGDYNLRKMMVDTEFVSQALPTSSVYQGEREAPCPLTGYLHQPPLLFTATKGSRPFLLNLHVGDVGHTAILGPTGAGKTTLNAMIMASHRKYPGSRIIVMDKDYSNRTTIKALGGDYFDLTKNECEMAPLARIHWEEQEHRDKAVEWLSACCSVQGMQLTPIQKTLLRESVDRLAKDELSYRNLNHLTLQDAQLREAIQAFNTGGFSKLLNGTQSGFDGKDVLGFDMSRLIKTDTNQRDLGIPVIQAIFNELEALFKDKRPTLLILEEAWLYLRHPLFREKLTDWFKTLRKANVAVIFISQDLDDIVKSNAASVIQSSCMTKLFLPNKSAGESYVAEQYRAFGLNEQAIGIICEAVPKQDYYYHSALGNRLFRLDLGALAKAFLCMADKAEIEQFDRIFKKDDPQWILDWLADRGLTQWWDFANTHYFEEG